MSYVLRKSRILVSREARAFLESLALAGPFQVTPSPSSSRPLHSSTNSPPYRRLTENHVAIYYYKHIVVEDRSFETFSDLFLLSKIFLLIESFRRTVFTIQSLPK